MSDSTGTRAAVLAHVEQFNLHDTDRLLAGMERGVSWSTGADVFCGVDSLRELFSPGLWDLEPRLEVLELVVDGGLAAARFAESLVLGDEELTFDIAAFFDVRDGLIRSVKVYREGSADIEV
jgi:hypothetical protein